MPKIVDHQARRQEISGIAARLIAAGGMEAATIREIARSSGYSKGVIEHYFDNKDELINGAVEWTNQRYELRVIKMIQNLTGIAALRKRITATLPMSREIRNEWKVRLVFWSAAAANDVLRKQQAKRFTKAVELFSQDINAAIEQGELPTADNVPEMARRLFTATIGIATLAIYNTSLYGEEFLTAEVEHLLHRLSL